MIFFLPYILSGLAIVVGFAGNWWLEVTDWQTLTVFAAAGAACVLATLLKNAWTRLIILSIVGATLYLKGGIDKSEALKAQHEADKAAIHSNYAAVAKAEQERQAEINAEALRRAAVDKEQYDADLAVMRQHLAKLKEQSVADPRADTPSLSLDAVRRLNSLRGLRRSGS